MINTKIKAKILISILTILISNSPVYSKEDNIDEDKENKEFDIKRTIKEYAKEPIVSILVVCLPLTYLVMRKSSSPSIDNHGSATIGNVEVKPNGVAVVEQHNIDLSINHVNSEHKKLDVKNSLKTSINRDKKEDIVSKTEKLDYLKAWILRRNQANPIPNIEEKKVDENE